MKLTAVVALTLMLAAHAGAESYSWTDDKGTFNFTDDLSNVPKKYRKNVEKRGDMSGQPEASRATGPDTNVKGAPATTGSGVGGQSGVADSSGLYGGKKPEIWQQDFRSREAEYKRLEQQLLEIENQIKKPVGLSKSSYDALPQEFKEVQKQYLEKLKYYNDLNDAANKAGLPAEFRK